MQNLHDLEAALLGGSTQRGRPIGLGLVFGRICSEQSLHDIDVA
jgi:hypothetical protein